MKTASLRKLLVLPGLALLASHALAANILIEKTIDLNLVTYNTLGVPDEIFSSDTSTLIQVGDTVTVRYDFSSKLAEFSTSLTSGYFESWLWLNHSSTPSGFTVSNAVSTLIDPVVTGTATTVVNTASTSSGQVHLGPNAYFTLGANSSVTFSGIETTFTVTSLTTSSVSVVPWLSFTTSNVTFSEVSATPSPAAVPEPATYGLLGAASLLGLGCLRRRNTRRRAA